MGKNEPKGKMKIILRIWNNSVMAIIVFAILGFIFGILGGYQVGQYTMDMGYFMVACAVLLIIVGTLVAIHYEYEYSRRYVERKRITQLLRYWYWSVICLFFFIFYSVNRTSYLSTYKANMFGIDQEQYILIVNLLIFFLLGFVIYFIIVKDISIAKISKEGIEITSTQGLQVKEQENLLLTFEKMIHIFAERMLQLDEDVEYLKTKGFVSENFTMQEYLEILRCFLNLIEQEDETIMIDIVDENGLDPFLRDQLGISKRDRNHLKKKLLQENKIFEFDENIFMKYQLGEFHNKISNRNIFIIIKTSNLYPKDFGRLIITFLAQFEALYAKYLAISYH